jgi:hypothetical protein
MFAADPVEEDWKNRGVKNMFGAMRWNQYVSNWPVVLEALRRLWETGKVSQLKTTCYEPVKTPKVH